MLKAHELLYHSTPSSRVIKKKKKHEEMIAFLGGSNGHTVRTVRSVKKKFQSLSMLAKG